MRRNVDLTLEREFRDLDERNVRKRLNCEECGRPIQIPWKYYCLKCWHLIEGYRSKVKCSLQLQYYDRDRKPVKESFHFQLRTPRWYYSKDMKRKCRNQLTDTYSMYRPRQTCRDQLSS